MNLRNLVIWGIVVVALIGIYSMVTGGGRATGSAEIPYSQLISKVNAGEVKQAVIRGNAVEIKDNGSHVFTAVTPTNQDDLVKRLEAQNAEINVRPAGGF